MTKKRQVLTFEFSPRPKFTEEIMWQSSDPKGSPSAAGAYSLFFKYYCSKSAIACAFVLLLGPAVSQGIQHRTIEIWIALAHAGAAAQTDRLVR